MAPKADGSDSLVASLTSALTLLAAVVSAFYVVGGLVLAIRLHRYRLPAEVVVSQLPKDYLLVVGLTEVALPTLVAAPLLVGAWEFGLRERVARVLSHPPGSPSAQGQGPPPQSSKEDVPSPGKFSQWLQRLGAMIAALLVACIIFVWRNFTSNPWSWQDLLTAAGVAVFGSLLSILVTQAFAQRGKGSQPPTSAPPTSDASTEGASEAPAAGAPAKGNGGSSNGPGMSAGDERPLPLAELGVAVIALSVAIAPVWVWNGATLPLLVGQVCTKSGQPPPADAYIIGVSDRVYLGLPVREVASRYLTSVAAADVTITVWGEGYAAACPGPRPVGTSKPTPSSTGSPRPSGSPSPLGSPSPSGSPGPTGSPGVCSCLCRFVCIVQPSPSVPEPTNPLAPPPTPESPAQTDGRG